MINSIIEFSQGFIILCLYSLIVSAVIYILSLIAVNRCSALLAWKNIWLIALIVCVSPIFYGLIPSLDFGISASPVFTIPSLNEIGFVSNSIQGMEFIESKPLNLFIISACLWLFIFIFIAAIKLIILSLRYQKVLKIIAQSSPILDLENFETEQSIFKILTRLQNTTDIDIVVTKESISPFIIEIPRRVLIISQASINNLSRNEFLLMLQHELAHISAHDGFVLLFVEIIKSVAWFNPFILPLTRHLKWAVEVECDVTVLNKNPHALNTYRRALAKTLLNSAVRQSDELVSTFTTKFQNSTSRRMNYIMNLSNKPIFYSKQKFIFLISVCMIFLLSIVFNPSLHAKSKDLNDGQITSLSNPVSGATVTSNYGDNNKYHLFHKGIDLAARIGTPIIAGADGEIIVSSNQLENKESYGTIVMIDHGKGLVSLYSHMNSRLVTVGETVTAGDVIGTVGSTGRSSGPHLHFELSSDGSTVNPRNYVDFDSWKYSHAD